MENLLLQLQINGDIVSNLIDMLEPVEKVTLEISRSEASISSVIPSIAVLKMVLQAEGTSTRGIKTLRETMLQSLQKRFARMEETKCLVLATLLDPRYKCHVFFAVDTLTKAKQQIKEEHAIVSDQLKTATTEDQGSDPKQRRVEDEELPGCSSVLEQMYANVLGPHGTPTQESDDKHHISEQLDQYLREPLIDRQTWSATGMVETEYIPPTPSCTTGKEIPLSTPLLCSQGESI